MLLPSFPTVYLPLTSVHTTALVLVAESNPPLVKGAFAKSATLKARGVALFTGCVALFITCVALFTGCVALFITCVALFTDGVALLITCVALFTDGVALLTGRLIGERLMVVLH